MKPVILSSAAGFTGQDSHGGSGVVLPRRGNASRMVGGRVIMRAMLGQGPVLVLPRGSGSSAGARDLPQTDPAAAATTGWQDLMRHLRGVAASEPAVVGSWTRADLYDAP